MVLLAILAAALTATSACRQRYAKEVESSVPTVTSVGTYDGCKVTKELWTSKKGNAVGEAYYLEKDGYVLQLIEYTGRYGKRTFRLGRADVPKPDRNWFLAGVFADKPIQQKLLSNELRQAANKLADFTASLSASRSDIVAATAPWMEDTLKDLSISAFALEARVKPTMDLTYGTERSSKGIAYVLQGPWWLDSWIVLGEEGFTVYIDTRDSTRFRGAYLPQKGTAVIRGTYDGMVYGGRIKGTELSEYRTGLLRESIAELEAFVPFLNSRLYTFPKDLVERCSQTAKTLKAVDKITWEAVVPENTILKTRNDLLRMVLDEREMIKNDDLQMQYRWQMRDTSWDSAIVLLHNNGSLKVDFNLDDYDLSNDFSYFVTDGRASVSYKKISPGTSLTTEQLASLVSFNAAVDAGLIKVPLRYAAAYKHLKELIADPTLPKGRRAVDFEEMAQDLLDELPSR
jgi:hypothetical protein